MRIGIVVIHLVILSSTMMIRFPMGNKRITVKGLKIFDVKSEENILLVTGSIPGPIGGMVIVRKAG